ncbi:prepilin-type N-terminal cleavage/methylation domain-containing protein [Patescibacteria group bacterium]|nr:MAG: prepilin-type N-terminal cleavage/methylation domain-containing protein [Patescibacteria group bacterium]
MITPMKKQGFSLIEIMVSLAIFAIVVVVATGALLTTIDATKKAQATQTVLTNLNLALEGMTREIRTGSSYGDASGATSFSFNDKTGTQVTYRLTSNRIERQEGAASFEAITAPEVNIQNLKFTTVKPTLGQPRVFITARGIAGNSLKYQTTFEIQTTVSQRKLNR